MSLMSSRFSTTFLVSFSTKGSRHLSSSAVILAASLGSVIVMTWNFSLVSILTCIHLIMLTVVNILTVATLVKNICYYCIIHNKLEKWTTIFQPRSRRSFHLAGRRHYG